MNSELPETGKDDDFGLLPMEECLKTMFDTQGPADACQEAGGKGAEQVSSEAARADDEAGGGREEEEGGQGGGRPQPDAEERRGRDNSS